MAPDAAARERYRAAYDRWQRDLQQLHRLLLEDEPLDPMHRIALLRSESHTHDRYELARRQLLGLEDAAAAPEIGRAPEADGGDGSDA